MKYLSKEIIPKKERPIKVTQFGEGNFLRAFIDWMLQELNEKTDFDGDVAVIQPLKGGRIKDLQKQDGLYTLYMRGIENDQVIQKKKVIDVLSKFINPYEDEASFYQLARSSDLKILISNTTEAGIVYEKIKLPSEGMPMNFPAKVLLFLRERYIYYKGDIQKGLHILPCELIDNNGLELKSTLNKIAKDWNLNEDFIHWLNHANTFYNTLVDRIVPGYPKDEIESITSELGYIDDSVVMGEVFHLWVIEGRGAIEKELPFKETGLNVLFVDDLMPYKQRKVRVLNGTHTAMFSVGFLYGLESVKESVEHPLVGAYVDKLIFGEIIPASTHLLSKEELNKFANEVIERFKNPFIKHRCITLSLNATSKFKARNLPYFLDYYNKYNEIPKMSAFSIAALLVFFKGEYKGNCYEIKDDKVFLKEYENLWDKYDGSMESIEEMVGAYLGMEWHWGIDLNSIDDLHSFVSKSVCEIMTKSMKEALDNLF